MQYYYFLLNFLFFLKILIASSISCIVAIPVEIMTFLLKFEIKVKSGRFVISPEGILIYLNFSLFKNNALSKSNGDDKKFIFILSQYF